MDDPTAEAGGGVVQAAAYGLLLTAGAALGTLLLVGFFLDSLRAGLA